MQLTKKGSVIPIKQLFSNVWDMYDSPHWDFHDRGAILPTHGNYFIGLRMANPTGGAAFDLVNIDTLTIVDAKADWNYWGYEHNIHMRQDSSFWWAGHQEFYAMAGDKTVLVGMTSDFDWRLTILTHNGQELTVDVTDLEEALNHEWWIQDSWSINAQVLERDSNSVFLLLSAQEISTFDLLQILVIADVTDPANPSLTVSATKPIESSQSNFAVDYIYSHVLERNGNQIIMGGTRNPFPAVDDRSLPMLVDIDLDSFDFTNHRVMPNSIADDDFWWFSWNWAHQPYKDGFVIFNGGVKAGSGSPPAHNGFWYSVNNGEWKQPQTHNPFNDLYVGYTAINGWGWPDGEYHYTSMVASPVNQFDQPDPPFDRFLCEIGFDNNGVINHFEYERDQYAFPETGGPLDDDNSWPITATVAPVGDSHLIVSYRGRIQVEEGTDSWFEDHAVYVVYEREIAKAAMKPLRLIQRSSQQVIEGPRLYSPNTYW